MDLLETHRSKISFHHAKAGYSYPTIHLPHTFSVLAGLPTRIYQTVHDGALAFLVVVSPRENALENLKSSAFTRRRSPVRIRPSPSFFCRSATLEPSIEAFSNTRIMVKKKHNEDKKLHNFDEKLHNSNQPDLTWQEMTDLSPEDEVEGGSEIYYFTDEDGNIHSREFFVEELIPDESEAKGSPKRKPSGKLEKLKPGAIEIINLEAPNEPPQQVTLPAPKSGEPPIDIRISSEVVPDLSAREESQQRSDVVAADKTVIIHLQDGLAANELVRVAHDRDARPWTLYFTKAELDAYVAYRSEGMAKKSKDWIGRSSQALWESTGAL